MILSNKYLFPRVFFSVGLILSYLKLFRFLTIVSYIGTKFLIMRKMVEIFELYFRTFNNLLTFYKSNRQKY